MSITQSFWSIPHRDSEPAFWVCMSCLSEVFYRKVPMPDCPSCHGVSTYEAFSLEAIRDWGTEDLISKALTNRAVAGEQAPVAAPPATTEAASTSSVESTL